MKSLPFALMLLLQIPSGLSQESRNGESLRLLFQCHFLAVDCLENENGLRDLCSDLIQVCQKLKGYPQVSNNAFQNTMDGWYRRGLPYKRSSINQSSFLLTKLHPLLNRGVDSAKVPTKYRRIGDRLGSELLGKRNDNNLIHFRSMQPRGNEFLGKRIENEGATVRNRQPRGNEFLGKRTENEEVTVRNRQPRGNEFLVKRTENEGATVRNRQPRGNEFLGKRIENEGATVRNRQPRGNEFLGKRIENEGATVRNRQPRGNEFLGKRTEKKEVRMENRGLRGTELLGKRLDPEMLGKRNVEMLGKRGVKMLGKRGTELLGKRAPITGEKTRAKPFLYKEECGVKYLFRVLVDHFLILPEGGNGDYNTARNNRGPFIPRHKTYNKNPEAFPINMNQSFPNFLDKF